MRRNTNEGTTFTEEGEGAHLFIHGQWYTAHTIRSAGLAPCDSPPETLPHTSANGGHVDAGGIHDAHDGDYGGLLRGEKNCKTDRFNGHQGTERHLVEGMAQGLYLPDE